MTAIFAQKIVIPVSKPECILQYSNTLAYNRDCRLFRGGFLFEEIRYTKFTWKDHEYGSFSVIENWLILSSSFLFPLPLTSVWPIGVCCDVTGGCGGQYGCLAFNCWSPVGSLCNCCATNRYTHTYIKTINNHKLYHCDVVLVELKRLTFPGSSVVLYERQHIQTTQIVLKHYDVNLLQTNTCIPYMVWSIICFVLHNWALILEVLIL